ncbi:unnamed protein product [Macrosiphum euphorbiae]|uniref:Uncharacterized protein n=1 Tax=Macrosiphum euphorbiae TaxID=13131 RepID=A0AAV0X8U4_9HEMI|nr:unnamed protein product [Macrosiphum euphorbiae]
MNDRRDYCMRLEDQQTEFVDKLIGRNEKKQQLRGEFGYTSSHALIMDFSKSVMILDGSQTILSSLKEDCTALSTAVY